jgi:hypothetical protein
MGANSVRRWVIIFKGENTDIANQSHCGQPRTATPECSKQNVDVLIRLMVRETTVQLGIGHHTIQEMIATLGYWKVCSHWVPLLLTDKRKKTRMAVSSQLLQQQAAEGDDFMFNIMTGGESWFHFITRNKVTHTTSPEKKQTRIVFSARKVTGTAFWDAEGYSVVDFHGKSSVQLTTYRYSTHLIVYLVNSVKCEKLSFSSVTMHELIPHV